MVSGGFGYTKGWHVPAYVSSLPAAVLSVCFAGGLAACHGGAALAPKPAPEASSPPSMAGLEARLQAELKRLGKDTAKTVSQAPKGAGGAVFDLHGTVIDPDGPPDGQGGGTQPPTGIQFTWTERLVGDYDMNGLVGLPDLVPISSKWHARPAYESPALHGGFASWPTGDPDDSSGSAAGPGATNWRVARVDGDGNGLIALPDIVPIAAHWQESLSGYRVYRKAPGESTFAMVADPDDASSPLTIRRSKWFPPGKDGPDQSRPVRYGLTIPAPEGGFTTGVYQFYVAAYDEASSTMGEPSATLSVELPANTVNLSPVAHLSLSPDFAGAPAVITLSASQSYDADGSIAEYRWDLDDDGTIDYSTSDPAPPAQSSGGTVKPYRTGLAGSGASCPDGKHFSRGFVSGEDASSGSAIIVKLLSPGPLR